MIIRNCCTAPFLSSRNLPWQSDQEHAIAPTLSHGPCLIRGWIGFLRHTRISIQPWRSMPEPYAAPMGLATAPAMARAAPERLKPPPIPSPTGKARVDWTPGPDLNLGSAMAFHHHGDRHGCDQASEKRRRSAALSFHAACNAAFALRAARRSISRIM